MKRALLALRLAIDRRKWILWVIIAGVLVIAWVLTVSLLPHHVVHSLQLSEEQVNGLGEVPSSGRTSP